MKDKKRSYTTLKTAFVIFFSLVLFLGISWGYLEITLKKNEESVDTKDYTIPYESIPDNCGLLLQTPLESQWLIYLDFEDEQITVLEASRIKSDFKEYLGYSIDYRIDADYELIAGVIDRVGGIELNVDGTTLRYTGIQVCDLLCCNSYENIKRQVLSEFLYNISKKGFSKNDFAYIIDNSDTDLTVPACFDWPQRLSQMCRSVSFVN